MKIEINGIAHPVTERVLININGELYETDLAELIQDYVLVKVVKPD